MTFTLNAEVATPLKGHLDATRYPGRREDGR
jgi:hypothetical protein